MRLIAAILILLVGCLAWSIWRSPSAPDLAEFEARSPAVAVSPEAVLTAPDLAGPASAPTPRARSVAPLGAQPSTTQRARVHGRVVDDQHTPIAGQTVRLSVTAETLHSDGTSTPAPEAKPLRQKQSTDANGRFAFEIDLPAAHWAVLKAERSAWYDALQREFAHPPRADVVALVPGENDLGDVVLATSGSIEGRVVTKRGEPVRGAKITLSIEKNADTDGRISTDRDGKFELARVPPGPVLVNVLADGFVEVGDLKVQVERASPLVLPDIVLEEGPRLSGIVVDETGAVVSGVRISGWPASSSGRYADSRTGQDGTFVMGLPAAVPYVLDIDKEPRFEPWAWNLDESARTFAPDTKNIRIVLVRAAVTTFHVIDAATRAPIERFGLRVDELPRPGKPKWRVPTDILPFDRRGGTKEEHATPGLTFVTVTAPGHAPAEMNVVHDAGSPGHMTIALLRASRLKGRLQVDGAALADASVEIKSGRIGHQEGGLRMRTDLEGFAGRDQKRRTDSAGAFEFDELAAGTYELRIDAAGLARTVLHDLLVPSGDTLDLGIVDVPRGATLRVRFITAANESPVGFGVWMNCDPRRIAKVAKADGMLEFANLEPGLHELAWARKGYPSWAPGDPRMVRVDLAEGEVRDLDIDVRGSEPCALIVRATARGKPVEGVIVMASTKDASGKKIGASWLGQTGSDGSVAGSIEGGSACEIEVHTGWSAPLATLEVADVPRGGRLERTLELRTGRLVLEMPKLEIPEKGEVQVHLTSATGARSFTSFPTAAQMDMWAKSSGYNGVWNGAPLDCGLTVAGEFDVSVECNRFVHVEGEPISWSAELIRPAFVGKVKIEEGREARFVVR